MSSLLITLHSSIIITLYLVELSGSASCFLNDDIVKNRSFELYFPIFLFQVIYTYICLSQKKFFSTFCDFAYKF